MSTIEEKNKIIEHDKIKKYDQNKENLIKEIKDRLHLFTQGKEEIGDEEIEAILNLLNIVEPMENEKYKEYFHIEKAVERFEEYKKVRDKEEKLSQMLFQDSTWEGDTKEEEESKRSYIMEEEEEGKKFYIMEEEKKEKKDKKSKVLTFFRKRKTASKVAMAASLLVLVVGVAGSVNADENKGFFHWLKKDETSMTWIASPTVQTVEKQENQEYQSFDEVPKKYKGYIWEETEPIDGLQFDFLTIVNNEQLSVNSCYHNLDKSKYLSLEMKTYENQFGFHTDFFDGYKLVEEKQVEGWTIESYQKEDEEETEYFISCFRESSLGEPAWYTIGGNISFDKIETAAKKYLFAMEKLEW